MRQTQPAVMDVPLAVYRTGVAVINVVLSVYQANVALIDTLLLLIRRARGHVGGPQVVYHISITAWPGYSHGR